MGKRHSIEEAVFDISFDSTEVSLAQQPELGSYLQERLLPIADEIFSEVSADGSVSRIELLEIDLGDINYRNFQDEMAGRFRKKLKAVLLEKIRALSASPSPSPLEYVLNRKQAERSQLEFFLETGRLARSADPGIAAELDQLLLRAVRSDGQDFAEYLKRTPHRDIVVKRLVRQFPEHVLAEIAQLLVPAQARILGGLLEKSEIAQRPAMGLAGKELIWERLISELLERGERSSDLERWFRKIMEELSSTYPKSAIGQEGVPPLPENFPMDSYHGLSDARGDMRPAEPSKTTTVESALSHGELLRSRLEEAMVVGQVAGVSEVWEELRLSHAGLVQEVFMKRMGDERSRKKLADGFPDAMLLDLVRVLASQHGGFIEMLLEQPELHPDGSEAEPVGSIIRATLWAYTLAFLHAAGTRGFDRMEYARGLVSRLSQAGLDQAAILRALARSGVVLDDALNAPLRDGVADSATGLTHEAGKEVSPPGGETRHAAVLYRRLVSRLSGTVEEEVTQEIMELASTHPEMLTRLYRQLQAGELTINIAGLSMVETRCLVDAFVSLTEGAAKSEFRREIEAQAGSAQDEKRYYQTILMRLIRNEIVDLEEAASVPLAGAEHLRKHPDSAPSQGNAVEKAQSVPDAETGQEVMAPLPPEMQRIDEAYQRLVRRLGGATHEGEMAREIDELASTHPEMLTRLYRQLQAGELPVDVTRLTAQEAKRLVISFIGLGHETDASGFRHEIEKHAGRARHEQRYYQHILDSLVRNRMVDLEQAMGEAPHEESVPAGSKNADAARIEFLQVRLESAFQNGNAGEINETWDELRRDHAGLVQATFSRVMSDERLRKKLAEGFPEAMLLDLARLLAPQDRGFIEALAGQPELNALAAGAGRTVKAIRSTLWEHTLAFLHAARTRGFDRVEYARGLMRLLAWQGMTESVLRQALVWLPAEFGTAFPELAGEMESAAPRTSDVLYQRLVLRLDGRRDEEVTTEIDELARTDPDVFKRLIHQLQSGELQWNAFAHTAAETRQLVSSLVSLNYGGKASDFREIEDKARKARNETLYYRDILDKLLHKQEINIEAAKDVTLQMSVRPAEPSKTTTVESALSHGELLRSRLEEAMVVGQVAGISGMWDELRLSHAGLVQEVFMKRMGDERSRKKLGDGFPDAMLLDLVRVLAAQHGGFMEMLLEQPELHPEGSEAEPVGSIIRATLWAYTLAFLHAAGTRGFDRMEYARGLVSRLSQAGLDQAAILRALARSGVVLDDALNAPLRDGVADSATGLTHEAGKEVSPPGGETRHAAVLYRRVVSRLSGTVEEEVTQEIMELASTHPEMLTRLYRQLQAGELTINIAGLSMVETRCLVDAFVSLTEGAAKSEFRREIEAQAGSARDEKRYYQTILMRLIRNLNVDLEEAASAPLAGTECLREHLDSVPSQDNAGEKAQSVPVAETGQKETLPRTPELQRADEAYQRLARRLGGAIHEGEIAREIGELASTHPEILKRLYRQLQAGELPVDVSRLTTQEAKRLVIAFIGLGNKADASGFRHEIEKHAGRARHEQRYYQHILDSLVRNRVVDLEQAMGEAPHEESVPAGSGNADAARIEFLRASLESALLHGNAGEISGMWDELRRDHASLVRATFNRMMGDEQLRKKLAQGSEAMLLDLARLLAPQESGFIEMLAGQPELNVLESWAGGTVKAIRSTLWEHTLAYLHAEELREFDRRGYARSLIRSMPGSDIELAALLQAITRADPALGEYLAKQGSEAGSPTPSFSAEENRPEILYQRLVQRLRGLTQEGDMAHELEELASISPETLIQLYRQLQAGELRAEVSGLTTREARQLVSSFIGLNESGQKSGFRREIEAHVNSATDEGRYYRHILDRLIHNQVVDLEAAAREALLLSDADTSRPDQAGQATATDEAGAMPANAQFSLGEWRHSEKVEWGEEIYLANAGMVLAAPYLPRLFGMLELTEDSRFKDEMAAERAIHLLQFAVNGSCDSPEFLLVLNKILCGMPIGIPIVKEIEPAAEEKEAIEGMLQGMIQNWKIIGNTSVQGLRESFLQRAGRLRRKGDDWHLQVEKKGIDVLLDQLPWSFSVIKYAWMARPVYVEWR